MGAIPRIDPAALSIAAGPYRLRPTRACDRAGIIKAGQSPTIGGKMPWFPSPFPEHFADGWITRAISTWGAGQHWLLSIVGFDDRYLGSVVLSRLASGKFELAYWVVPDEEGRGIASAAARAMIDWSHRAIRPPGYFAKARLDNRASRRVLLKTGFVETGEANGVMNYALD
jgi:ribosomal-protein-alanine N-acetyltransferase